MSLDPAADALKDEPAQTSNAPESTLNLSSQGAEPPAGIPIEQGELTFPERNVVDVTPAEAAVAEEPMSEEDRAWYDFVRTLHEGHGKCLADAVEAFYETNPDADEAVARRGVPCDCGGNLCEFNLSRGSWIYKGLASCPHRMANHAAKLYERTVIHDWQCDRCRFGYAAAAKESKVECETLHIQ